MNQPKLLKTQHEYFQHLFSAIFSWLKPLICCPQRKGDQLQTTNKQNSTAVQQLQCNNCCSLLSLHISIRLVGVKSFAKKKLESMKAMFYLELVYKALEKVTL